MDSVEAARKVARALAYPSPASYLDAAVDSAVDSVVLFPDRDPDPGPVAEVDPVDPVDEAVPNPLPVVGSVVPDRGPDAPEAEPVYIATEVDVVD